MTGSKDLSAATHFGRQVRKERLAHGWSLAEFSRRTGIDDGHLSRIENGRRPPTEALAQACDAVFPERRGWFYDWYSESRTWSEVPPGFRSWSEYEDSATVLRVWSPSIVDGLLQTQDYARALLATSPRVTDDTVSARLENRMERQRRVIMRQDPPSASFAVDELSLYRLVGSAEIMDGQLRHLAAVAALPHVTLQILPAIAHPANAGGFIVADGAAWCEHVAGGYVFTSTEMVSSLNLRFDSLRAESYRASESASLIDRMGELWASGVSPLTATPTAGSA